MAVGEGSAVLVMLLAATKGWVVVGATAAAALVALFLEHHRVVSAHGHIAGRAGHGVGASYGRKEVRGGVQHAHLGHQAEHQHREGEFEGRALVGLTVHRAEDDVEQQSQQLEAYETESSSAMLAERAISAPESQHHIVRRERVVTADLSEHTQKHLTPGGSLQMGRVLFY
eukprot:CAMPEP_0114429628 /NCGR_PEP_ID=MMETSP0103-20121206/9591_1 /TAXON_ID=37642 ORGANISM="Paraphysomonas imperforata, Strain PA2" /NCGR_SAMPLE_ID=MMETSP0103 /ASSEMBLY_ACC=CAM_ASM_000201 /LENGTH=170 /DNA_ID=CAMNT_0001598985 /DNA_START=500 /DNA_END=1012 /DNA_ORIENTATION=-